MKTENDKTLQYANSFVIIYDTFAILPCHRYSVLIETFQSSYSTNSAQNHLYTQ